MSADRSWSYGTTVTGCPPDTEVMVDFTWYVNAASAGLAFNTNTHATPMVYNYAYGNPTPFQIRGKSDANGTLRLSWGGSAGALIQNVVCTEYQKEGLILDSAWVPLIMLGVGLAMGKAYLGGVRS